MHGGGTVSLADREERPLERRILKNFKVNDVLDASSQCDNG